MGKGCIVALAATLLLVLALGGCAAGAYNDVVDRDERVEAAWTEIQNQYKRRFDLVPQLVETVKGAAEFEQETITAVTEARASVGRVQLPPGLPEDEAALQRYVEAQQQLGSALSRLLVVAEQYPQLKASQNFLALQDQLEGTENRIAVARNDYITSVEAYNSAIRRVPTNLIAGLTGFERRPQLEFAEEGLEDRPEIDFDFGGGD